MNRSILIVICDFLLLSLLAFSTVDINKVADQGGISRAPLTFAANSQPEVKDLTAVMRLALDEERKGQTQLQGELARAREDASRQQALASQRERLAATLEQKAQTLAQRAQTLDEQVQSAEQKAIVLQQELQARDQQVRALDAKTQSLDDQARLAEQRTLALQQELRSRDRQVQALDEKTRASDERARALQNELDSRNQQVQAFKDELQTRQEQSLKLEQDRAALLQQYAAAQTNITTLSEQLREGKAEGALSRDKLAAMEDQVRHHLEQSLALQQQLTELARSNEVVAVEKERLSGQLQVAETEKRMATGQVARMQDEVKAEREERFRLAENFKVLTNKWDEFTEQVRISRALAPNTIFSEFATNRVDTQIFAVRPGMFGGESTKKSETQTVMVSDGTNNYALCHVQETPLSISQPGVDWDGLSGTLSRNAVSLSIRSISFAAVDPRVVLIPVTADEVRRLGCRVYKVCADPYKFQDAVLVGAREGYYGQCGFQIDLATPDYVKLDHNALKGLFGKFNPSRGDLVFSKAGELIGVMANNTYCLMLRNFGAEATFKFGADGRGQRTGTILAALYSELADLPSKLSSSMLTLEYLGGLFERHRAAARAQVKEFALRDQPFDFNRRSAIMGVVNLSPDSWYRESVCLTAESAIRRALALHAQGADLIDLGAESTLAHAARVDATAQKGLLLPVLEALRKAGLLVSVETYEPAVTRACLEAGADVLNLTGTRGTDELFRMVAANGAAVIICYVQGDNVREVGDFDFGADPVALMRDYFARQIEAAQRQGVDKILMNPGLGFYYQNLQDSAVRVRHQMTVFLNTFRLRALGFPVCHALPHAFEYFGEEVRCAEPFFAVLAALGQTDLFRTHEVPRIRAVLRTLETF